MVNPTSPEFHESQGISLNELTQAYAQAMGSQTDETEGTPRESPSSPDDSTERLEDPDAETDSAVDTPVTEEETENVEAEGVPVSPRSVVEALLFVGSLDNQPLPAAKAAELMRGVTPGDVAELIEELNDRYRTNGCPYKVVGDGSGYRMTLRKYFHPIRNKFYGKVREARLSQAAIDTLAIVAYRQPLTSEQVSQLRGTPSGHLLTQLVRRQLLEMDRSAGSRKTLYRTSKRFLEMFNLENLKDLPDSE